MVSKKFKATEGAQFTQHEAQIYGKELDRIAQLKGGQIKPIDVIEEARNKKSLLHPYFDWNNLSAAEKHRIEQARHLINHITVIIKYNHTQKEQKAFFSVNTTPTEKQKNTAYVTVERVLSEPELKEQILIGAIEEVEYWNEKYRQYKELSRIFSAIKITKKKIVNGMRKAKKKHKKI